MRVSYSGECRKNKKFPFLCNYFILFAYAIHCLNIVFTFVRYSEKINSKIVRVDFSTERNKQTSNVTESEWESENDSESKQNLEREISRNSDIAE